jgi:diguanylate cyclase (GGDEF)-like protein/PAS domain S-box-containing protein
VWVELTNHNFLDDPTQNCVVAEMVDVSYAMPSPDETEDGLSEDDRLEPRQRRLYEALHAREQVLHRLAESLPLGVIHVDTSGRIIYANQRLLDIVRTGPAPTLLEQLSTTTSEDAPHLASAVDAALNGGLDNDIEIRLVASDADGVKEIRQCTLSLRVLNGESGEIAGAVVCVMDVTDSVRMREELRFRATFDALTQCHNRASTIEALEVLTSSPGPGGPAVIFVDLDQFKTVNDRLGHAAGDELLEVVARRLGGAVRTNDLVGRIGGDEFLVVCPSIETEADALRSAERLSASLAQPVQLKAGMVDCRASVGVAWSPEVQSDPDSLVQRADAAMYEAKRSGSGRPVLWADRD